MIAECRWYLLVVAVVVATKKTAHLAAAAAAAAEATDIHLAQFAVHRWKPSH